MQGSAAYVLDASFAKRRRNSNAAKHLRLELRFAHGSNINVRGKSCGKLKANGVWAKCLATKSGQGGVVALAGAILRIQPKRASGIFAVSSSTGGGTAIPP
jgi:hypothetical protein